MPPEKSMKSSLRAAVLTSTVAVTMIMTQPDTALGQAVTPAVARSIAKTQKPPLHGKHWMAITGKPLAATAGAMMFQRGGNAVDAACAMLAATSTMWDVLSWGGETQALIYDPRTKKVIAINGLGIAPSGATPEFFRKQGLEFPPAYGPLAAVTPGTPGGLMLMLAEYGTLSLADVLGPSIELADGYPIDGETADNIERWKEKLKEWPYSKQVMLPHLGQAREAPRAGEIFRQPDLAATLRKLVDAEKTALAAGRSRKEAIQAAYDRFYRGDVAQEFVRSVQEQGGLITLDDLAKWRPLVEEPLTTSYRGIDVYKLDTWTQGPALLQSLNLLEHFDLKAQGYNSANRTFLPPSRARACCRRSTRRAVRRRCAWIAMTPRRVRAIPTRSRAARILTRTCSRSSGAPQSQRLRRIFPRRRTTRSSRASRAAPRPSSRPMRKAGWSR
jgi:gamma-glutamyltranspeptidase/glutathione hydrolase